MNESQIFIEHHISKQIQVMNGPQILKEPQIMTESQNLKDHQTFMRNPNYK